MAASRPYCDFAAPQMIVWFWAQVSMRRTTGLGVQSGRTREIFGAVSIAIDNHESLSPSLHKVFEVFQEDGTR